MHVRNEEYSSYHAHSFILTHSDWLSITQHQPPTHPPTHHTHILSTHHPNDSSACPSFRSLAICLPVYLAALNYFKLCSVVIVVSLLQLPTNLHITVSFRHWVLSSVSLSLQCGSRATALHCTALHCTALLSSTIKAPKDRYRYLKDTDSRMIHRLFYDIKK